MNWALEQREIKDATARHVLLCLANYADKDGRGAFPSVASLSEDTGLSERTIRYKLDDLLAAGLIRLGNQAIAAAYIGRHDRRPTVYDLAMNRGAAAAPGSERGANDDRTGCISQQNGVQMTTERGAAAAPNPSYNHQSSINKPKQRASTPRAPVKFDPLTACPPNASPEVWAAYCDLRKAKRATLTENACALIAKKLVGHPDPDGVLNLSTQNGWTGIFPEQVSPNAAGKQTRGQGAVSAVDAVKQAIAAREAAEAAAAAAGQAVVEDGGDLRPALDGEFRRVG